MILLQDYIIFREAFKVIKNPDNRCNSKETLIKSHVSLERSALDAQKIAQEERFAFAIFARGSS